MYILESTAPDLSWPGKTGTGGCLLHQFQRIQNTFLHKRILRFGCSWIFSFRGGCLKEDAHDGTDLWTADKKHAKREVWHRVPNDGLFFSEGCVHPPAFARLDQSNQIYLLQ